MSKLNLKETMRSGLAGGLKPQAVRDNPLNSTTAAPSQSASPPVEPAPATVTKSDLFKERVTLPISEEQRVMVESLARKITKNGMKKPERITANTVIRSLVNLLENFDGDISSVTDEESLNKLMRSHFTR